jgi:protein phosphatase
MPEHCLLERNPPRVDATLYRIKSAGRTRKGGRRQTNCDYICNFEFTVRDAEHGFYAVADGSLSSAGGERASEVAIQTLSSAVKASPSGENALDALISSANKALIRERDGMKSGDSFVSSLVCGYLENGTLHVAAAGNGAAYLIQNRRIQRLTENQAVAGLDDPGLNVEHASKGLLGLNDGSCFFSRTDVRLNSGDSVVFCSDGIAERLDSVAILETVVSAESPEQAAAALLDKAAERGAADDTSVVVVTASGSEQTPARFVKSISYPPSLLAAKLLVSMLLLAGLAAMIHFFQIGNTLDPGPRRARQAASQGAAAPAIESAPDGAWSPRVLPDGASTEKPVLFITSDPPGASVTIDGEKIEQPTPVRVSVDQAQEAVIEFSLPGYLTKRTTATVKQDGETQISATLQPVPDLLGGFEIRCAPACDDLLIDGAPAEGVKRPFRTARVNAPAGQHTLEAVNGVNTRSRTASVEENKLTTVEFVFGEQSAAPAMPAIAQPAPQASSPGAPRQSRAPAAQPAPKARVEVVTPSASAGGPVSKTGPTARNTADSPAYVTVEATSAQGAVPGCRVMFFQGGRLAATGSSGSPIKLEPGSYQLKVSRDGFAPYETQKYIASGSQSLTVFISGK